MSPRPVVDRVSSGQATIDAVLGGGLPVNSVTLLAGAPGAGKTMLAQQYAFANGTVERPAVIVTTVNEPLDKVVRFGQALDFFDVRAVGSRVVYESVADTLVAEGLTGFIDRLMVLLATLRPGLLVIDSFRALSAFAPEPEYRRFVSELGQRLSATALTAIWAGEYDRVLEVPEAAVADAIVQLRSEKVGQRRMRFMEVLKLRGGGYLSGEHGYRLGPKGVEAFVRLADPADTTPVRTEAGRISLGQDALDAMIGGGVWPGTSTLLIGASGTGKTMLALDFLRRGAAAGSSAVFATLQESPSQIARVLWGDGQSAFEERIYFHHRSPVDIDIDEWVGELFEIIEKQEAELLVIDSVTDLRLAARDDKRFEEYVYSLSQRLSKRGVTTLMTLEAASTIGISQRPTTSISSISDNIVLLGYRVHDNEVGRAIHVLKSRASAHDATFRSLTITSDGPIVGEPLEIPDDAIAPIWTSRGGVRAG